jgi:AcrR family transcriptional regulator
VSKAKRSTAKRDPEGTRSRILRTAVAEFSDKGLDGARVDAIAARARINKRMLYHYFGNKEALYRAALECVYADIRDHERTLRLEDQAPLAAMRTLVTFTWDYFIENPRFLSMLNTENLHRARFLKGLSRIPAMHSPLVTLIAGILERGVAAGLFRRGVDPTQLYISIAALAYFYLSNVHTLSTVFSRDFRSAAERRRRRDHIVEVILGYLRP